MIYQIGDVVTHTYDGGAIGIVTAKNNVEWWRQGDFKSICPLWDLERLESFIKGYITIPEMPDMSFAFHERLYEVRADAIKVKIFKGSDSLLVRKIKELDYKWELRMKEKGTFYLTSRAQNADQETTSQSTPMDTATVSDANTTSPQRQQSNTSSYPMMPRAGTSPHIWGCLSTTA